MSPELLSSDFLAKHFDLLLHVRNALAYAKITSLQEEAKKARQAVLERERAISFFGRDMQKIVNLTDPKDWLLYDTGFVLKMKNKSPLKVSLRGLMRIVENLRDSDSDSDSE